MQDTLIQLYPWMHLVGRVLFAMIFVMSGIKHLTGFSGMKGYATFKGVPSPGPAVAVSGLMILVGGIFIALGWHRFIGAGLIVIFCPLAAVLVHAFWKESDPMARANEMAHFMKNIALAGGALFMAVYAGGWWPMSLGG